MPRTSRGFEEGQRRQTRMESEPEEFRNEPRELIDAGERVVVVAEISAIGKQIR